jgi:hypothetical protein
MTRWFATVWRRGQAFALAEELNDPIFRAAGARRVRGARRAT